MKIVQPDRGGYWTIYSVEPHEGMRLLRDIFTENPPNCDNFVLFSTSGIHGNYATIEDAESDTDRAGESIVTFIVVAPRIIRVHYGNCCPANPDDFAFLKRLRAESHAVVARIGMPADPIHHSFTVPMPSGREIHDEMVELEKKRKERG